MPKRSSEDSIECLKKRLKKIEKKFKLQIDNSSESSSSSSSSSSRSSSPKSASPSGPAWVTPDDQNDRDEPAGAFEDDAYNNQQIDPPPSMPPTSTTQPSSESTAGPSTAGPSTALSPPPQFPPTVATLVSESAGPITGGSESHDVDETACEAELLDILGVDPSVAQDFGEEINKEVASRFEYLATSGLDKQARKDLLKKILVPSNCKNVAAPQLNAEIRAAITDTVLKRDKAIEARQKQIAAAITNLGRILTAQLNCKERNNSLLKQLMDTSRILCDIQHSESTTRRNYALYSLKKDFKEQLSNTKIDKYLFGADLSETLKTAKAVSKSSTDIKFDVKKQKPLPRNLNWKAGPPARRQQAGPTHKQQPAAPTSTNRHHGTSSHKSSHHRPKHTRRQ